MKMEETDPVADPGDDTGIMHVIALWAPAAAAIMSSPRGRSLACIHRLADGEWQLALAVDRGPTRRQRHFISVDPDGVQKDRWGLVRLGDSVWTLARSVHIPGQFHAFVTLVNVPEPAPWR